MTIPFSPQTQAAALKRQGYVCASCGSRIWVAGRRGAASHRFGEGSEGHHVIPFEGMNGPNSVENCVVLCKSCHNSAHQGGRFADIDVYSDLPGHKKRVSPAVMAEMIESVADDYPHYRKP
ncbi:MAG: hypothetical protein BGP06_08955 [Rhizobiales bacterium 65-9]|nr:HNH endonuclease [Hyphomicrobiales bacterium]OJY38603.1 MAG: hypothetical protein BGP06_08955 [Rhizobiales bacterium 65-9]